MKKSKTKPKSNNSISLKTTKKRAYRRKVSSKSNNVLTPAKIDALKTFFFMSGVTSNQAAIQVGCDPKTARTYFTEWAEELTEDINHVTWVQREQYTRARFLEGVTQNILATKKLLDYFTTKLLSIIHNKKGEVIKSPDEELIEKYERYVRSYYTQYNEYQQQYLELQLIPPTGILLQKEIERTINEKQSK